MATTLTIAGAADGLNAANRIYKKEFNEILKLGFESQGAFTIINNVEGTYTAGNAVVGEVLQRYQPTWTPKNTWTLDSQDIVLEEGKIDIVITPAMLDTFLGKWDPLLRQMGDDPRNNNFALMMYEKFVIPQYLQELELLGCYNGDRAGAALVGGTAGLTVNTFTGIKKRIEAAITATTLTPIVTGAITSANALTKLRDFCRALGEVYQNRGGVIYCSRAILNNLVDNIVTTTNYVVDVRNFTNINELAIPTTNFRLKALPSMTGSNRLIYDGSKNGDNIVMLIQKGMSIMPNIHWETQTRELRGWADLRMAFGIEHFANLFVNDQA